MISARFRQGFAGMRLASLTLLAPTLLALACAPQTPAQSAAPAAPVKAESCALTVRYQPQPAASIQPALPAPKLETRPIRDGDAYTVWGASSKLRSRYHRADVTKAPIAIRGYVIKTNLPDAPKCAVHRAGQADPVTCRAPIPTFWLGDEPDASLADSIQVMGFASNYAQIFEAIRVFDSGKPDAKYEDAIWGSFVPNPLPATGAKVTVHGSYAMQFSKASSGTAADSVMGILTYERMDVITPAATLETLPGVKRK